MKPIIVSKEDFLVAFLDEWKKVPELRFMQLIVNLQQVCGSDMFYKENGDVLEELHKFTEKFATKI